MTFCGNYAIRAYLVTASRDDWNSLFHRCGASLFFSALHSPNPNVSNEITL